ncbi:HNH endonuclease [Zoogloea oleivorans]|uniref:HNH endonuclease n=1 Tax=Zoogloea oleivorans TaxID=1552750 RepID=A0A6C2C679_9RHOO|nr:HNH endonuclease signature motif containing protein [Zoogloea oleivorans]TYC48755.1 HNH endonuclease [Zoogloea oleivorans]
MSINKTRAVTKEIPSQIELRRLFDCSDGKLFWKVSRQKINIGDVAGSLKKTGYTTVTIDRKIYRLHRLIYQFHKGDLSADVVVDHIDGNPANNRIENLQVVSQKQNLQKITKHSNNTSGLVGVCWHKKSNKWRASYIDSNGKFKHIGYYTNKYQACHERCKKVLSVVGERFYVEHSLSTEDRDAYNDWLIAESERNDDFLLAA